MVNLVLSSKQKEKSTENDCCATYEDFDIDALTNEVDDFRKMDNLCQSETSPTETHISMLPIEVVVDIFRWVVSSHVDINSLQNMALACKWFYTCSRAQILWRAICLRLWGKACAYPLSYNNCWRRMCLERLHVNYGGIYISTASYVRRDQERTDVFYRPHHVQYYKYVRFFPDGSVFISTTEGKRSTKFTKIELPLTNSGTMSWGHFRQEGDSIRIVASYSQKPRLDGRKRRGIGRKWETYFYLTLELERGENSKPCHLDWLGYSVEALLNGRRMIHRIEPIQYKSFEFYPIPSYSSTSLAPV